MSIFKIIENNIEKAKENYDEFLTELAGDTLDGANFMFYSLDLIFNELNIEDIEYGIIDSSYRREKHDYGIDAIYITANREIIKTVEELDDYNEDTKFQIQVFQFKKGKGIEQADLLKLKEGIKRVIIDEDILESDNEYLYEYLLEFSKIKSRLYDKFLSNQIIVKISIVFGGIESNVSDNGLATTQINNIKKELSGAGYTNNFVEIIGAEKLIEYQKTGKEITDTINYLKSFKYISETTSKKLNGYIGIVNAIEIARLVKEYQSTLFEANIRDYYRKNELNKKIFSTTVDEDESKYFWSYNNGLTITCRKVEELPNDKLRLHGLQIVNGCQTSNSIYQASLNGERLNKLNERKSNGETLNERENQLVKELLNQSLKINTTLLIKIVETNDPDLTYKITETTNSQTPIKSFSLKANEDIQKLIEEYLKQNDIYYERRINSYRNKGIKNIVSIQKLFQVYVSQILFKPSQVKTRPKSLFKDLYDDVFPSPQVKSQDYSLYLIPIKLDIAISKYIRKINRDESDQYNKMIFSYAKLHLGVTILHAILRADYTLKGIVKKQKQILDIIENQEKFAPYFNTGLVNLRKIILNLAGSKKESIPVAVKRNDLDERIVRFVKKT